MLGVDMTGAVVGTVPCPVDPLRRTLAVGLGATDRSEAGRGIVKGVDAATLTRPKASALGVTAEGDPGCAPCPRADGEARSWLAPRP